MKYIVSERFLGALQDYELLGRPAVRWDLSRMTPLREDAAAWLLYKGCDYERGVFGAADDRHTANRPQHGGCQSGIVRHLIYYNDTVAFFKRHRKEIEKMLLADMQDCGASAWPELFRARDVDLADPFCRRTQNKNLLAWYGFESAVRSLVEEAEANAEVSELFFLRQQPLLAGHAVVDFAVESLRGGGI